MTITNTWTIVQMDAYPEADGETDVVFNVHWTLTGTDGAYSGSVRNTVCVARPGCAVHALCRSH